MILVTVVTSGEREGWAGREEPVAACLARAAGAFAGGPATGRSRPAAEGWAAPVGPGACVRPGRRCAALCAGERDAPGFAGGVAAGAGGGGAIAAGAGEAALEASTALDGAAGAAPAAAAPPCVPDLDARRCEAAVRRSTAAARRS